MSRKSSRKKPATRKGSRRWKRHVDDYDREELTQLQFATDRDIDTAIEIAGSRKSGSWCTRCSAWYNLRTRRTREWKGLSQECAGCV